MDLLKLIQIILLINFLFHLFAIWKAFENKWIYPIRCLLKKYRSDAICLWILPDNFEIWHASRKHCLRGVVQFHMIRWHIGYWNGRLDSPAIRKFIDLIAALDQSDFLIPNRVNSTCLHTYTNSRVHNLYNYGQVTWQNKRRLLKIVCL